CNRPDLRDQLANDFPRFKELAQSGGTIHAFDNPERLIEKISKRAELSAVIAKLQYITGARIHEIRIMEIGETTITINKGKGGRKRVLDFSRRLEELAEVKNLVARLEELADGVDWQAYCQGKGSPYQGHVKAASGRSAIATAAPMDCGPTMPRSCVRNWRLRALRQKRQS